MDPSAAIQSAPLQGGNMTLQIVVLIILLLLSAFFSSAETALTTVNKIKMRSLAEDGNKNAKLVLKLNDNASKMLSAILIGNNIVNLSASALTTTIAIKFGADIAVAAANGQRRIAKHVCEEMDRFVAGEKMRTEIDLTKLATMA